MLYKIQKFIITMINDDNNDNNSNNNNNNNNNYIDIDINLY